MTSDLPTNPQTPEQIRPHIAGWARTFEVLAIDDKHLDVVATRLAYRLSTRKFLGMNDVKVAVSGDPVRWEQEMRGERHDV